MHLFQFHYLHVIGRTPGLGLPCAETCCCLKEKKPLWKFTYWVMKLSPGTLITTPSLDVLLMEGSMWAWSWELLLDKAWGELPTALKGTDSTSTVGSNSSWDLIVRGNYHFVRRRSWCIMVHYHFVRRRSWHSHDFVILYQLGKTLNLVKILTLYHITDFNLPWLWKWGILKFLLCDILRQLKEK